MNKNILLCSFFGLTAFSPLAADWIDTTAIEVVKKGCWERNHVIQALKDQLEANADLIKELEHLLVQKRGIIDLETQVALEVAIQERRQENILYHQLLDLFKQSDADFNVQKRLMALQSELMEHFKNIDVVNSHIRMMQDKNELDAQVRALELRQQHIAYRTALKQAIKQFLGL